MKRLFAMAAMVLAFGFLVSADAQDAKKDDAKKGKFDPEAIFKKIDANSDGVLSKEEYLKFIDRIAEKAKEPAIAEKMREKAGQAYDKAAGTSKGLTLDQFRKLREEIGRKKKDA